MAQRVDGRMDLRALPPFRAVVAGARPRFRRRLQRPAVENHRRVGCGVAARLLAQQDAQIVHDGLETPGPQPALGLLIDRRPRRQIVRHHAPRRAGAHQPPHRIEHVPQVVRPLRTIEPAQGQIRRHQAPLLVAHITGIAGRSRTRGTVWPSLLVPNSRARYKGKYITGSSTRRRAVVRRSELHFWTRHAAAMTPCGMRSNRCCRCRLTPANPFHGRPIRLSTAVTALAVSPDGSRIAAGLANGQIQILDAGVSGTS